MKCKLCAYLSSVVICISFMRQAITYKLRGRMDKSNNT